MPGHIPASIAKSRLARSVQRGDPPDQVAYWRGEYYSARARDYLGRLMAAGHLPAAHRAELAQMLLGQGGDDLAA